LNRAAARTTAEKWIERAYALEILIRAPRRGAPVARPVSSRSGSARCSSPRGHGRFHSSFFILHSRTAAVAHAIKNGLL